VTVLIVDTSAAVSAALIADDGTELASQTLREQRRHAELLTPMITELLQQAAKTSADITTVVSGTGPAPFTGLRVGLVTARTFAFGVGKEALGVPSLDATASQAADQLDLADGSEILVVSDARRKEVYFARYAVGPKNAFGAREVTTLVGPDVASAAHVVEQGYAQGAVVVGEGAQAYADAFAGSNVSDAVQVPSPVVLGQLALGRAAAGLEQPTTPLYLRRPDAQVPASRKRALGA